MLKKNTMILNCKLYIEIERNRGYCMKPPKNFQDRSYYIDAVVFMPLFKMQIIVFILMEMGMKSKRYFFLKYGNVQMLHKFQKHEKS